LSARRGIGKPVIGICLAAVLFHGYQAVTEWGGGLFALGLLAWSLVPYGEALVFAGVSGRPLVGIVSAAFALIFDARTLVAIQRSTSSTAAIDYLTTPLANLIVVVPLSAVITWVWLKLRSRGGTAVPPDNATSEPK
jgi:hypothetical protein